MSKCFQGFSGLGGKCACSGEHTELFSVFSKHMFKDTLKIMFSWYVIF